ncbi:hypothetical protein [Acrocarpospora corrugata]|uniref:hypothetical protein n=1 Tax=Acrocarpospora corrugata TaxID=35763 RepID=UPI0012D2D95C|nr:hypothetical protein [Acrocarpospora corrugata]
MPDLTPREAGLRLLALDRDYLWQVGQACIRRPQATVWPMLCTLQHLALINYEGRKYLERFDPGQLPAVPSLEGDAVRASRHANKLFLDTDRYVDGVAEHYGLISKQHHHVFFADARGRLGRLLDWLRDDLGVVRYRQHLIGTTHTVHYNSGLPPEAFGPAAAMGQRMHEMARGMAAFAQPDPDSVAEGTACWLDLVDEHEVESSDAKSWKLYESVFAGNVPANMAAALISVQAACSTAELLTGETPRLPGGSWPVAVLKLRYITLFQVLDSLKRLAEVHGMALPGPEFFSPEVQEVLSPGGRALRNTLVHYGVIIPRVTSLPADRPLFGLVELLMGGLKYDELCAMVDELLRDSSEFLRGWSGIH